MNKETPNSGIDHDTVVANWNQNAERHDDENYGFLRSMKFRDYGFDPDELAGELHEQAFQIVDCTRCANCCKTLNITFDDEDIERSDGRLNMPTAKFMRRTWKPMMRMARYKARQKPCPFLGDDDRCTIYEVRPTVCREYPHTDKEGFTFRTRGVASNTLGCPAVFWIVEQMKQRASC